MTAHGPSESTSPEPGEAEALAALDELLDGLAAEGDRLAAEARDDFQGLLGPLITALTGLDRGDDFDRAVREGCFLLNECTVVLRHNADHDTVDMFCDIGAPEPHRLEQAYRTLLEWNLRRLHPGLWFGAHPDSGRLVATLSLPMALAARQTVTAASLEAVTRLVLQLRAARALPLV